MNDGFRQRLVGALVLICLAVILWPIVFSNSVKPVVDRQTQIPPMPQLEKYTIPEPQKPKGIEPVNTDTIAEPPKAVAKKQQVVEQSKAAVKQEAALDKRGLPVSWVLQVASLSQLKSAQDLVNKLKKEGYKSYSTTVNVDNKKVFRVFVGPKFKKEELEKARKRIDKAHKVGSRIVRYKP